MEIVILFATGEGQTRKIAEFIADISREKGHEVTLVDVSDRMPDLAFEDAGKVILAASVHERRHPKAFEVTLRALRTVLERCPSLMISVSLKAAFPETLDEARDYLTEMQMRTGFTADESVLVGGAVRTGSYDYFQTQIVRHVALQGQDIDWTRAEHEFTDWQMLSSRVESFLNG